MGVYVADSDSDPLCEKAQTTTAPKQSNCPFVLFRQLYRKHREKREQQYRTKVDEMREQVNKSRKKVERCLECPWQRTTSTEERHVYWERAMDSGTFEGYGFKYSKGHKYKMTRTASKNGVYIMTYDFCTSQGREEAFKWWDREHRRQGRAIAGYMASFEAWEETFQRYIHQHHSGQRRVLLQGVRVKWFNTKVEALPN
jgi:hypothetical protein